MPKFGQDELKNPVEFDSKKLNKILINEERSHWHRARHPPFLVIGTELDIPNSLLLFPLLPVCERVFGEGQV